MIVFVIDYLATKCSYIQSEAMSKRVAVNSNIAKHLTLTLSSLNKKKTDRDCLKKKMKE